MTHHIKLKKDFIEEDVKKIRSNKQTLYSTRCNWCTKDANQFGSLGADNFVPIKDKSFDGKQAVALFCDACLARPERVNEPKKAFILEKRGTNYFAAEISFSDLVDGHEEPEPKEVPEPEIEEDKKDGLEEEKEKGLFVK
jgi:hypothetical protein